MSDQLDGLKLFPGGAAVEPERNDLRGRRLPAEWSTFEDSLTGCTIRRFTSSFATDQHPYFTSPAVTSDGQRSVFISERTGHPNLFSLDMATGEILQLTDNRYGVLRQYVYPWGNRVGFGKASVVLNADSGHVYYLQGRQVRRVNAYTAEETCIAELPPGWVSAFTHVSSDDSLLCIPLIPEAAFAGSEEATVRTYGRIGFTSIEQRVRELGLESILLVIATDGSHARIWAQQNSWITHVQFRPGDNSWILFNNEGIGSRAGTQRMWMANSDGNILKIRPEPEEREMWICHEIWTSDGAEILYHGRGPHPQSGDEAHFYGFVDDTGTKWREYFLRPEEANPRNYGHFSEHIKKDCAYFDGFTDMTLLSEASPGEDGWAKQRPIGFHGSQWLYQDDHPHPILTPDKKMLIFSSSLNSLGDVYGVEVGDE